MNKVALRPWQLSDAQALANIANNKKIWDNVRDRFPHPYTVKDAIQWINLQQQHQPIQNFAILYDGQLAGSAGVLLQEDVARKSIEIGYFVGEAFWGKGIATQAVRLLIDYTLQHFDVVRLYAQVFETNAASMKVLEKNEFYLECIRKKAAVKNNEILDDYVWVRLV
jgi:RimJ/RimL family protein N-acetyltransferase